MNIELHIERLILDGLPVRQQSRAELRAAVETELARRLAAEGLSPELLSGAALRSMRAGEIHVTDQMNAAILGTNIARAVHAGIGAETAGKDPGSSVESAL